MMSNSLGGREEGSQNNPNFSVGSSEMDIHNEMVGGDENEDNHQEEEEDEEGSEDETGEEYGQEDDDSVISTDFAKLHLDDINKKPNLDGIAEMVLSGKCKKILVLSGAGVSVSAGIPDFRSPGTGLYDNLQRYNLPFPEAVFDVNFYRSNPQPFISLAADLWPGIAGYSPTLSHSFIRLLQEKNILLRNYTQNIDGLEVLAGVSPEKMVECHGHFRHAACIECKAPHNGEFCKQKIVQENVPPICNTCRGLVKPDIVFFGESLPRRFSNLIQRDLASTDLLIVMGTSLKVAPVSLIPEIVNNCCPRVLFNRDLVGDFLDDGKALDVWEGGDCDTSVEKFCRLLGWEKELKLIHEEAEAKVSKPASNP